MNKSYTPRDESQAVSSDLHNRLISSGWTHKPRIDFGDGGATPEAYTNGSYTIDFGSSPDGAFAVYDGNKPTIVWFRLPAMVGLVRRELDTNDVMRQIASVQNKTQFAFTKARPIKGFKPTNWQNRPIEYEVVETVWHETAGKADTARFKYNTAQMAKGDFGIWFVRGEQ